MYKKLCRNCGAVSVFLVIVLVPTIVCASLFVDASRVKSARGLVSSAGELTLNTVLSQYDVDLNDFYGLMASAQDTEDVIAASKEYFMSCIKSQDIDTTNASKWVNSITNVFLSDGDVSDLLGIELSEDSAVEVSPAKNGNLTNPALVKTQVVEFMKYRSPINAIVNLFEKFKSSAKELENSKKSSDLIDKKQEYFEAQGEVAKKAYEIYQDICEYNKLGITKSDLQEMKTFIDSLEGQYSELHNKMVKDLYNTDGINDDGIARCRTLASQPSSTNYSGANAQTIGSLVNSVMRAYDQLINATSNFNDNIKSWPTSGNAYYDIQYWAYCCKNKSYFTAVSGKENNLVNSYKKLFDAVSNAESDVLSTEYTSTYDSSHLSGVAKGTQKSLQEWWDFLQPKIKDAVSNVTGSNTKYAVCVNHVLDVSNVYDRISSHDTDVKLAELYNTLNGYATRYTAAFDLLGDIVRGLGELKELVVTADGKFDTWETTADSYASDINIARTDQQEIATIKNDNERNSKLKTSDIQDYIDHINNVKSALGTVKNGIPKISYCGQSIINKNIDGFSAFKRNSVVSGSEIPMYEADIEVYAKETFEFSTGDSGISSLQFNSNNDPEIANSDKYVVYDWMLKQGFNEPEDEEKKNRYNEMKKQADDLADDADNITLADVSSENDISELEGLASAAAELDDSSITTKIKDVANFVGSLFNNFGATVSQAGVDIRDDLFVLDYITSMMTWHTFEYEAKYNMLDKSQQKDIHCGNAGQYYSQFGNEWKNTDVTQKYNKTLTNKLRNSEATNWSYCNEVEYIMYGNSIEESKNSLKGSIFMIRFALDAPAIFKEFYGDDGLKTFALGVNTASHGIIPAGLVKVIICLGLTALESSKDLKTLLSGIPVILVKTKKDDLFVKNWLFLADDYATTDKTEAVTFSYSDYMKLILFIKLLGSDADGIYSRLADVIQTNMSKCVLKDDGYSLKKSQVYYKITANVKVRPLMLDTSYVKSFMGNASQRMDNWNTIDYSATRGY